MTHNDVLDAQLVKITDRATNKAETLPYPLHGEVRLKKLRRVANNSKLLLLMPGRHGAPSYILAIGYTEQNYPGKNAGRVYIASEIPYAIGVIEGNVYLKSKDGTMRFPLVGVPPA